MSGGAAPPVVATVASGGDPGAARQGNFINYYQFNSPDKRLEHINKNFLRDLCGGGGADDSNSDSPILALDVGCNSGVSATI